MTEDTKKAQSFYTALLGWTTQDHDMGDMTYTIFMAGDKNIGGMLQTPQDLVGKVPPHWMSYICVKDIDATLEKAKNLGAHVKVPVTNAADKGKFAIMIDPTGAHIAFWQSMQ